MGRRGAGLALVLAVVVGLAACGGSGDSTDASTTTSAPDTTTGASTTTAAPATTTTVAPTTTAAPTTTTAPAELVLGATGIGVAAYGDPKAATVAAVSAILGPPTSDGPGCEPAGPSFTTVRWSEISLDFIGDELHSYGVRPPSELRTEAGIGLGDTVADLQAAYGPDLAIPGLPPDFGGDNFAVSFDGTDRTILGTLSSTGPAGTITALFTSVCE